MSIDSAADFDGVTRAGRVVAEALNAMVQATRAGITTRELDSIGASVLKAHGSRSAPQVVYGGEDGWTLRTHNGCRAAHHEHTIIITKGGPIIVTIPRPALQSTPQLFSLSHRESP